MKARDKDIETAEGRAKAMKKLANELFYQYADRVLDRPSGSFGTGDLTCMEFVRLGKSNFRKVEEGILSSGANVPLAAILRTYKRYMPQLDGDYVDYMIVHHGRGYNTILNKYDLQDADARVECLAELYKNHGYAEGMDEVSPLMTFDHETIPHDVMTRTFSNSAHIHKPNEAAHYSYIGLMNAVCDLFLNKDKQDPAIISFLDNTPDPDKPGSSDWGCAA